MNFELVSPYKISPGQSVAVNKTKFKKKQNYLFKFLSHCTPTLFRVFLGFFCFYIILNYCQFNIVFFQNSGKFKTRYSTLGFSDKADLDDGAMWPTVYAITKLGRNEEAKIISLVKKALKQ